MIVIGQGGEESQVFSSVTAAVSTIILSNFHIVVVWKLTSDECSPRSFYATYSKLLFHRTSGCGFGEKRTLSLKRRSLKL